MNERGDRKRERQSVSSVVSSVRVHRPWLQSTKWLLPAATVDSGTTTKTTKAPKIARKGEANVCVHLCVHLEL